MSEWISVEERLPEVSTLRSQVLVANRYGEVQTVSILAVRHLATCAHRDCEPCWYSHWMPLPPPPEQ